MRALELEATGVTWSCPQVTFPVRLASPVCPCFRQMGARLLLDQRRRIAAGNPVPPPRLRLPPLQCVAFLLLTCPRQTRASYASVSTSTGSRPAFQSSAGAAKGCCLRLAPTPDRRDPRVTTAGMGSLRSSYCVCVMTSNDVEIPWVGGLLSFLRPLRQMLSLGKPEGRAHGAASVWNTGLNSFPSPLTSTGSRQQEANSWSAVFHDKQRPPEPEEREGRRCKGAPWPEPLLKGVSGRLAMNPC